MAELTNIIQTINSLSKKKKKKKQLIANLGIVSYLLYLKFSI